jgi:hypothetical protein
VLKGRRQYPELRVLPVYKVLQQPLHKVLKVLKVLKGIILGQVLKGLKGQITQQDLKGLRVLGVPKVLKVPPHLIAG